MFPVSDHELQQSPGLCGLSGCWKLAPGQALSLRPRVTGVLRIRQGRAWATLGEAPRGHGPLAGDHFLLPGEQLLVQPGRHLVLESLDQGALGFEWLPCAPAHETLLQPLADLYVAVRLAGAASRRLLRGLASTVLALLIGRRGVGPSRP
jgi:hypothetical protein